MKVIVIGAGVVGVTSAWYLTQEGHDVTVLEAREGVALETSFANGGGICPGFSGPWAAPGIPFKAMMWMLQSSAPLKIRPRLSPAQWLWLMRFTRNCTSARFARNKASMQKMAHYSKACLVALREETGIEYDHGTGGVIQLFETPQEAEGGKRSADVLQKLGIDHRLLTPEQAYELEPGLAQSDISFSGALQLTTDETGDCHLFCRELAKLAEAKGATFHFNRRVTGFAFSDNQIAAVKTADGDFEADTVVVATGPQIDLLSGLGIKMPIYPVKGYAFTTQITDDAAAPRSSIMDEHSKVMVTRLGNRLRAAGVAELAGYDRSMPEAVLKSLRARVEALFPGAADYDGADYWHGFRPMTPDGPSRVQKTHYDNLFLNLGHGSNGWTQACGTGRVLADLVSNNKPAIDLAETG